MKFWAMFRQSFVVLILCGIGGILAGTVLANMTESLKEVPGLIVLIPAIIGMKGNIFTTLGSRLGSAVHMGLITPEKIFNRELAENVKGTMILAVLMSAITGVFASLSSYLLSLTGAVQPPNYLAIIIISIVATFITSIILIAFTVCIVYVAFKKGLDPDNITGPTLATLGDFIALLGIFVISGAVVYILDATGVGL